MVFDILILVLSFGSTEPLTLQEHGGGCDHRFKCQYLCVCELNANIQTNLAGKKKKKKVQRKCPSLTLLFSLTNREIVKPTASNISYRKWKANSSTILESL